MRSIKFTCFMLLVLTLNTAVLPQSQSNNKWQTKFEQSDYLETDRYEETINYFKRLEAYSSYAKLVPFGISPQGRKLYCFNY